jgi:hypothetical protein
MLELVGAGLRPAPRSDPNGGGRVLDLPLLQAFMII